jgi:hypothetical protein
LSKRDGDPVETQDRFNAGQIFILINRGDIQKKIIGRALTTDKPLQAPLPLPLRLMARFPFLRRNPARVVGIGVRPEHVGTPEAGG